MYSSNYIKAAFFFVIIIIDINCIVRIVQTTTFLQSNFVRCYNVTTHRYYSFLFPSCLTPPPSHLLLSADVKKLWTYFTLFTIQLLPSFISHFVIWRYRWIHGSTKPCVLSKDFTIWYVGCFNSLIGSC